MADEATDEDAVEATPQTEDAVEATPQQDEPQYEDGDYESRFNDLRPQYDRVQNEVRDLRTEKETLAEQNQQLTQLFQMAQQGDPEALDALGLALEEEADAEEDDYEDPDERIARLEARVEERDSLSQEEQEAQQEIDWLDENLGQLESKEGAKLSEKEVNTLVTLALNNRLDNGQPDLDGAYQAMREIQADYQKSYVESKRAPKVPAGTAGTEKLDLSTDDSRQAAMQQIMEQEGSD